LEIETDFWMVVEWKLMLVLRLELVLEEDWLTLELLTMVCMRWNTLLLTDLQMLTLSDLVTWDCTEKHLDSMEDRELWTEKVLPVIFMQPFHG
jgi:hypothetical protein